MDKGFKSLHNCLWHKERRENQGVFERGGAGCISMGGGSRRRRRCHNRSQEPSQSEAVQREELELKEVLLDQNAPSVPSSL